MPNIINAKGRHFNERTASLLSVFCFIFVSLLLKINFFIKSTALRHFETYFLFNFGEVFVGNLFVKWL
jgi:hypothetical protein